MYSQYLGKISSVTFLNVASISHDHLLFIDPTTGIPVVSDPLGPGRVPQHINTNHNLMLHEQLFPAASRTTGFIIPEVTLDRLSR